MVPCHGINMENIVKLGFFFCSMVYQCYTTGDVVTNACTEQTQCGGCIAADPSCAWCMQDKYDDSSRARCDNAENLTVGGCDAVYIVSPENNIHYIRNEPPRNSDHTRDAIQLSPQEIMVELRPNQPLTFEVTFRLADNYPVDLYYIMDLSSSMEDDLTNLGRLGYRIASEMTNITKNFQLGFGSFVDKTDVPFVSIEEERLQNPCLGSRLTCVPPYSFKNHLSLTTDTRRFTEMVRNARVSGSLDSPEGALDGMMQAVVCSSIGWRNASRKLLLVSTDNEFHYALDGRLGGFVKPNDGRCHLDQNNLYSEHQDYPSVSHLAYRVNEEKVNVIFAVAGKFVDLYERLSKMMPGSVVGQLASDSSNIVDLIKDNYQRISSKVELKTDPVEGVYVQFKTSCTGNVEMDVASCEGLRIGESVTFKIQIEVKECPADPADLEKLLTIYPVGLAEKLLIRLRLICSCPCEHPNFPGTGSIGPLETNSAKCNGSGTYQCGACSCNPGHFGQVCQCDSSDEILDGGDVTQCKRTNTSEVCEGRGQCECGQCICNPLHTANPSITFSGKYCECNDFSCDFSDGVMCGGPEHGVCRCGKCDCNPGFEGSSCNCPTNEDTCLAANGMVCNGKGACVCGKCECSKDGNYRGPTCEECPTCPGKCQANKACVECRLFNTGPYVGNVCETNCDDVTPMAEIDKDPQPDRRLCKFMDEEGCAFYFTYFYDKNEIWAQETKECPKSAGIKYWVIGVIVGILLIGAIILGIWKFLVTVYDKREVARFEEERLHAKWQQNENPLFEPSTSTVQNPTFGGKTRKRESFFKRLNSR